jgi:hypothetical protein
MTLYVTYYTVLVSNTLSFVKDTTVHFAEVISANNKNVNLKYLT